MFSGCENIIKINLNEFNTKHVTNMKRMFNGCKNLENIDFSNFDTKNVIDISSMFYHCEKLEFIDLSNFVTKNVQEMFKVFGECKNLKFYDSENYNGLWVQLIVMPLAWLIIKIGVLVKNYGLAIIVACLIIRGALYPLTRKTALQSELIKKAQSGDKNARNQMIEGNLKLVLSVVQRFASRAKSLDDIFQIGTIGLIKAVDNFDISQNTKFSTYAVPMIIGEIRRYMRDNTQIRVSRSMRETAYKAVQIRESILSETGKEPTIDEISEKLNIPSENIIIALESISDPVSLSEPVFAGNNDENLTLMDQIGGENDESWPEVILIKDQIKNLDQKEKLILSLRFLSGLTQTKVAKRLNISQAQVSRIEKNAIKKIKNQNLK